MHIIGANLFTPDGKLNFTNSNSLGSQNLPIRRFENASLTMSGEGLSYIPLTKSKFSYGMVDY